MRTILKEELEQIFVQLRDEIDPLVTFDEACKITGKTKSALYSKISRSNIRPVTMKLIRYSDCIKIKEKKI